jgi:hypothetical protein
MFDPDATARALEAAGALRVVAFGKRSRRYL